jgi:hypothetical protein
LAKTENDIKAASPSEREDLIRQAVEKSFSKVVGQPSLPGAVRCNLADQLIKFDKAAGSTGAAVLKLITCLKILPQSIPSGGQDAAAPNLAEEAKKIVEGDVEAIARVASHDKSVDGVLMKILNNAPTSARIIELARLKRNIFIKAGPALDLRHPTDWSVKDALNATNKTTEVRGKKLAYPIYKALAVYHDHKQKKAMKSVVLLIAKASMLEHIIDHPKKKFPDGGADAYLADLATQSLDDLGVTKDALKEVGLTENDFASLHQLLNEWVKAGFTDFTTVEGAHRALNQTGPQTLARISNGPRFRHGESVVWTGARMASNALAATFDIGRRARETYRGRAGDNILDEATKHTPHYRAKSHLRPSVDQLLDAALGDLCPGSKVRRINLTLAHRETQGKTRTERRHLSEELRTNLHTEGEMRQLVADMFIERSRIAAGLRPRAGEDDERIEAACAHLSLGADGKVDVNKNEANRLAKLAIASLKTKPGLKSDKTKQAMALAAVAMSVLPPKGDFRASAVRQVDVENEVRTVAELGAEGAADEAGELKTNALAVLESWGMDPTQTETQGLVETTIDQTIASELAKSESEFYPTARANLTQGEMTSIVNVFESLTENARSEISATLNAAFQFDVNVAPIPGGSLDVGTIGGVGDIKLEGKAGTFMTARVGLKKQQAMTFEAWRKDKKIIIVSRKEVKVGAAFGPKAVGKLGGSGGWGGLNLRANVGVEGSVRRGTGYAFTFADTEEGKRAGAMFVMKMASGEPISASEFGKFSDIHRVNEAEYGSEAGYYAQIELGAYGTSGDWGAMGLGASGNIKGAAGVKMKRRNLVSLNSSDLRENTSKNTSFQIGGGVVARLPTAISYGLASAYRGVAGDPNTEPDEKKKTEKKHAQDDNAVPPISASDLQTLTARRVNKISENTASTRLLPDAEGFYPSKSSARMVVKTTNLKTDHRDLSSALQSVSLPGMTSFLNDTNNSQLHVSIRQGLQYAHDGDEVAVTYFISENARKYVNALLVEARFSEANGNKKRGEQLRAAAKNVLADVRNYEPNKFTIEAKEQAGRRAVAAGPQLFNIEANATNVSSNHVVVLIDLTRKLPESAKPAQAAGSSSNAATAPSPEGAAEEGMAYLTSDGVTTRVEATSSNLSNARSQPTLSSNLSN